MPEGVIQVQMEKAKNKFCLWTVSSIFLSALKYLPLKYVDLALLRPWMAKLKVGSNQHGAFIFTVGFSFSRLPVSCRWDGFPANTVFCKLGALSLSARCKESSAIAEPCSGGPCKL